MPNAVRRISGVTALALALFVFEAGWIIVGLAHAPSHPFIGWLAPLAASLVLAFSYFRVSFRADLPASTRRFWRHLGIAGFVLFVTMLSNMHDAVAGPEPSQLMSHTTVGLIALEITFVLWALLRLPSWGRTRGDWARFGIDTSVLVITFGALLWHFSLRYSEIWSGQNRSMLAMLVLVLIGVGTIAKVSFAGAGKLDPRAMHLLCGGAALAAASGGLAPLLVDRPYLTTTLAAVPTTALFGAMAGERQRRAPAEPPPRSPGRRFSVLPYFAVVAMTITLLVGEADRGGEQLVIAICVAALTGLVVVRQVSALRHNNRLLDTVDANLRQLHAYQEELAHQVSHDTLTGIANRASFTERLTARLAAGEPCHVALLDLDDFKVVNDRFGHGMGDALLRAVSRRLRERLREHDVVARLGGDEFTLLLPDLSDADAARLLTEVTEAVQEPLSLHGHDLAPRLSIGITAAQEGDTPEELIRRADVAMYAAKTMGGGRFTWFDQIMDRMADADVRLAADLRQAIARDELFVLYQPIVELPHGRLAGVEALLRWRHPEHGLVSPGVFIPLAERNGYIVELGRWVLEQVVRQAREWELTYGEHAPEKVSVNISARQLREPGFPAQVAELVRSSGLDPYRLVAEVTETAVLGTGEALEAVRELHAFGMRVALDDFGTGQSSLSLLVDTPVKVLKVDKSFVDGVTGTSAQAVIVDGLIGITEGLRIEAVAEGVETADQAFRLHKMGYRFAQGFHFARPMHADDIALLLDVPAGRKVGNLH
jgi:diguanylate cyclase (GGDEF)-like protein